MTRIEQKEAKKMKIIQAALDLFVERGYYGTKTSQISRRAGISEGLLFHYFPTKEILLEELVNIGLEGMLRILDECRGELGRRFAPGFLRQAKALEDRLIQLEAIRIASGFATAMQQVGSGGILGTLWEVAEAAHVGLAADLKKMSIRQETVEICEYYHLNPYQMTSAGCILMITEHGERLVQALNRGGARAGVLGVTTAGNARVVTSGEERRFLDRPAPDELMRWWAERLL